MVPRAVEGARAAEVAGSHRAAGEVGCHRAEEVAERPRVVAAVGCHQVVEVARCLRGEVVAESTRPEVCPRAAGSPRVAAESRRAAVEGEWAEWSCVRTSEVQVGERCPATASRNRSGSSTNG